MDRVRLALRPSTKHNVGKGTVSRVTASATRRVKPIKSHDELKRLANCTKANTSNAILELQNELKRMSGRVVDRDHKQEQNSEIMRYIRSFSLNPQVIINEMIENGEWCDSTSSSE